MTETLQSSELGEEKQCTRCGEMWPADGEFFPADPNKRGGLYHRCKACYKESRGRGKAPMAEVVQIPEPDITLDAGCQARAAQLALLLACGEVLTTRLVRDIYGVSKATAKRDLTLLRQAIPAALAGGTRRTHFLALAPGLL